MTLVFIDFVGIWPGFDSSQNSVGLRGSDDPEGVTAPQVFQVMMKFLVFCLFLFTNFWWVFKPYQKLHWYTTKGFIFFCADLKCPWRRSNGVNMTQIQWIGMEITQMLSSCILKSIFFYGKKKSYFSCYIKL